MNTTKNIKTTFSNVDDLVFFLVLLLLVVLFGDELIGLVTVGDVGDKVGDSGTDEGEEEDSSASTMIAFLGVSIIICY